MNNSWHNLLSNNKSDDQNLMIGEWFTVRFSPDKIRGEVFNIGVVFIDKNEYCHYQLIHNADAFTCLFGEFGKANINFLLKVVDEVLGKNNYLMTPSPHIEFSSRQTAQGNSIEEILEDLFNTMVSLVCHNEIEKKIDTDSLSISTKDLRNRVFGQMKISHPNLYERIYQKKPYTITNPVTQESMIVDMPIRLESNTDRFDRYGSIVSAAYLSDIHRIHNINYVGVTNIINCCEFLGRDIQTTLIIYLPEVDVFTFTETVRLKAKKELKKCLYVLHQMKKDGYNIMIEVEESPEACLEKTIEFIN